jgi:branched-chain amino acid transport system ATP-binding protein
MLTLTDLTASYGAIVALRGVSLEVPDGGIVALLGANGAGKSSTLRVISGLLRRTGGTVEYDGYRLHRRTAQEIVSLGVSHVPEGRELFMELTVEENLPWAPTSAAIVNEERH